MRKSNEAVVMLTAAGYEVLGSPSGKLTVLGLAEIRTLPSGKVVKEYKPVWRGERYTDAVKVLLEKPKKKK